ncbi:MAG: type II secretion system F family protein [Acidimicrobiales bacterium]
MTSNAPTATKRGLSLLALLALILALVAPAAAAQDTPAGPAVIVANAIDATDPVTKVTLLADTYDVAAGDVVVTSDDGTAEVKQVQRATAAGEVFEMVYVIDSSNRLAQGNVFENVKASVASAIDQLPEGTIISVVDAGDTAVLRVDRSTDKAAAKATIAAMEMSGGAKLFNALDRAAALIDPADGRISTIIAFSGGIDTGSTAQVPRIQSALIAAEAQLISVRYQGGESQLDDIVVKSGGLTLGVESDSEVTTVMGRALSAASDRLLVSYDGSIDSTRIINTTVNIGAASVSYSHAGGIKLTKPVSFPPREVIEPSGFAFFRSDIGLYVALGLAFAAIGLAIFSLGSLFAGGETSLEGLISRYSGDALGDELDEEESAIVQTALVRRAVEMSESFAEDRGFLVKVEEMLERARVPLRPGEAMGLWAVGILVSGALGMVLFGGIFGGLIMAVIGAFVQIFVLRFKARRRMRQFEQQLPDALQLLAGTLRAGYSLPQGLEAVSHEISDPMGFELRRVMTEARLGRELEDALASAADRLSSPDFAWAVMAIAIQREVGGNLNELLMTVSDTMVQRERLKGEVAALTAEGKASTVLLGGMPPGLGLVMYIMNAEYMSLLFTETLGKIMLAGGLLLMAIGMAWMKKVMTINV